MDNGGWVCCLMIVGVIFLFTWCDNYEHKKAREASNQSSDYYSNSYNSSSSNSSSNSNQTTTTNSEQLESYLPQSRQATTPTYNSLLSNIHSTEYQLNMLESQIRMQQLIVNSNSTLDNDLLYNTSVTQYNMLVDRYSKMAQNYEIMVYNYNRNAEAQYYRQLEEEEEDFYYQQQQAEEEYNEQQQEEYYDDNDYGNDYYRMP